MQERGGRGSRAGVLLLIVPSDRLAGTAGDARISERAGAESREGIRLRDAAAATGPSSGCVQPEEYLLERLAARLVGAHDLEPALLEHADARSVVLDHAGMQRALGDLGDEVGDSARGNPATPMLTTDPVPDQPLTVGDPAADISDDFSLLDDRACDGGVVGEDLLPVGRVSRPVPSRKRRHCVRGRVGLLAVEDLDVVGLNVAQHGKPSSLGNPEAERRSTA